MFARKVNGSLAHALVAAKVGVLPHAPAGVAAQKIRVAGGVAQRRLAGIVGADAREDRLQLLKVLGQFFRTIIAMAEIQHASYPVSSSASQVTGAKAETLDQLVHG